MSDKPLDLKSTPHFASEAIYKAPERIFEWRASSLEDTKNECLVVLDTNVLIAPYNISQRGLKEVERTYRSLLGQSRLFVPSRVAREFAKVRMEKLGELHQKLTRARDKEVSLETAGHPILMDTDAYKAFIEARGHAEDALKSYRSALDTMIQQVRTWGTDDPVTELYRTLFHKAVVVDIELKPNEIIKDLEWRDQCKIPPGYKDSTKIDSGIGDLLIWKTIIQIGSNARKSVIFVSEDRKADWWHQSDKQALYVRHELIEEFREATSGQSFHIVGLADLLQLYGTSGEIVDEVRSEVEQALGSDDTIQRFDSVNFHQRAQQIRAYRDDFLRHRRNAVELDDGYIYLIRYMNEYGAIQPLHQTSTDTDGRILYDSWFISGPENNFMGNNVHRIRGEAMENRYIPDAYVQCGPLKLRWSKSSEGSGWLYFGPTDEFAHLFAIAPTMETDISRIVDVRDYQYLRKAI